MSNDYIFKAFVVNSAEYDNGNKETSGAWLTFPTTKDEVSALFKEIGLPNNADSGQYFIDEYRCGNNDLLKILPIHIDIDELNYLANRISELEDIEMTAFQTAIRTDECKNIKDAINITYNTECFDIVSDMSGWENIGEYIAEREGCGIGIIGKLADYIDYEAYGRDCAEKNCGYFFDDIYLEKILSQFIEKYSGDIEDIPSEYIVTEQNEPQTMTVVIVKPMQEPYTKEIPIGLRALQKEVGGNIQVVYPFAEPIGLICNEEGKNEGLNLNRALYDAENQMYDIVAGTFILAGLGDEDFTSLPPEHIKQMTERFKQPEIFINDNGKIKAIHVKPSIKAAIDKMKKEQDGKDKPQPQKKPPNQAL